MELEDLVGFSYKAESEMIAFRSNPQVRVVIGARAVQISRFAILRISGDDADLIVPVRSSRAWLSLFLTHTT